ncbi:MAG TPA: DNA repair protein RadC, partial [Fibrobacteria bacterium]|nr:DNA repair protein RadC [Fibrobacteria bacterium]
PAPRIPKDRHRLVSSSGHRARLRDKVLADGLDAMAPHELLELLLCYAIPRVDVKPLAKSLLEGATLGGLLTRDPARLVSEPGIGPHAASLMALCARIHRELVLEREGLRERCLDPEELVPWFRAEIGLAEDERFAVVYLDQQGRILGRKVFDPGSRTRTVLYARELFDGALRMRATGLVLAHNHPAGSLQPSSQDRDLTRRVREIGAALEVALVDHLIVTRQGHASFCRSGWL